MGCMPNFSTMCRHLVTKLVGVVDIDIAVICKIDCDQDTYDHIAWTIINLYEDFYVDRVKVLE
jgi:hypothetical protein